MADIYSSTTRTQRGEGHVSLMNQTGEDTTTETRTEGDASSVENIGAQKSTTEERPGVVTSKNTQEKPKTVRREIRPQMTTRQEEAPVTVKKTQESTEGVKISSDDYGIKLTFKISIRDLLGLG